MLLQQRVITKADVISKVSELDIYNTYLKEPLTLGSRISSPFRPDSDPSFGFFKGETEICWKDLANGDTGDCIQFVKKMFPGFTFFDALSKIATDFQLSNSGDFFYKPMNEVRTKVSELTDDERLMIMSSKQDVVLKIRTRQWSENDAQFWQQRGVNYQTLLFYRVQPITHIFLNDKIIKADDLAYAFLELKDGVESYKIYQPFNKNGLKWLNSHDSSVWQGWSQLPPLREDGKKRMEVVVTKSLKDVMAIANIMRIPAVSLQSENTKPKPHVIEELLSQYHVIYILYDNDFDKEVNVGRLMGLDMQSRIKDSVFVEIPEQYKSKDFSDLVLNHGAKAAHDILDKLLCPF